MEYCSSCNIHRLEFLSFLPPPLDVLEWRSWVWWIFFLEVESVAKCFGLDPVLAFLKIFQFPFSSEEDTDLPLWELRWLCSFEWSSLRLLDFFELSLGFVHRVLPDVILDVGESLLFDDSLELTPDEENGARLTPLEHPLEPEDVGEDDPPRWWWLWCWGMVTLHSLWSPPWLTVDF